jgi:hypothetical protein
MSTVFMGRCDDRQQGPLDKGESILVVDDVKEQRDLAASILKALNYSVPKRNWGWP